MKRNDLKIALDIVRHGRTNYDLRLAARVCRAVGNRFIKMAREFEAELAAQSGKARMLTSSNSTAKLREIAAAKVLRLETAHELCLKLGNKAIENVYYSELEAIARLGTYEAFMAKQILEHARPNFDCKVTDLVSTETLESFHDAAVEAASAMISKPLRSPYGGTHDNL